MSFTASAAVSHKADGRQLGRDDLAQALADSRRRSLGALDAWQRALGPGLRLPERPELNLPLWEMGHIGWFADWWLARNPEAERQRGWQARPDALRRPARQAARGFDADAAYNSSRVAHRQRWRLDLPDRAQTEADLQASLADTLALLAEAEESDQGLYFFRLALFHEDMHNEAAVYMAQQLGVAPATDDHSQVPCHPEPRRLLALAAQPWTLGSSGPGFAFDNECPPTTVALAQAQIDHRPLTWADYLPFVEAGGYRQAALWSEAGWTWVQSPPALDGLAALQQAADGTASATRVTGERLPRHLRRSEHSPSGWQQRRFGEWLALDLHAQASHLSAFEAEAWCRWAGRRLPSEAEWECAAHQLPDFVWGGVWEWTASPFAPFPGFVAHPYLDYSQPWFDGRPVLRGASHATHPRLRSPKYRNYFPPGRNDLFAGFRSAAR